MRSVANLAAIMHRVIRVGADVAEVQVGPSIRHISWNGVAGVKRAWTVNIRLDISA